MYYGVWVFTGEGLFLEVVVVSFVVCRFRLPIIESITVRFIGK